MSVIDRLRSVASPTWHGSPDVLYELISNSRRRLVIEAVNDGPKTQDDLAVAVARAEYGAPITSTERKRVYIALYQVHLDKLEDAEIIQSDGRDTYRRAENHAAALAAIEAVDEVVGHA